ncbi:hypothetical protein E3N88_07133 [Mikania micrantha]|uniref:Reverse transcriptase domain-containing protein n=1 Tax=Mikania micrantha TaxID=192012 RepID=A0A5N6PSS0_9ASTR|nr:hypothetical protein E3N88_07133 [Mikania micrantha]
MTHIESFTLQIQSINSQAMKYIEALQFQVQSINSQPMIHIKALQFQAEQEIGNGTTRRKHGGTCGKGARKIMKTSMKRLPLEFDFQTRRVISETDSAFMHEYGYIENNCSFQFKDWRLVPNVVRMPLRHKLTVADESLIIPVEKIHIDEQLHFIEEPLEIMDREVKQLKQSRTPIVKVRWNSKRGPEFTWEREDHMKIMYPHLFTEEVVPDNDS